MCAGCATTWSGLNVCHCSQCHQTFSVVGWFDEHRRTRAGKGACVDPAGIRHDTGRLAGELKMKQNKHGVWVGAEARPEGLHD